MRILAPAICALIAAGLIIGVASGARPATGVYKGTTSEGGTVTFTVAAGGAHVTTFTTTDGYNRQCKFSGGAGGLANFPVRIASMPIGATGIFTATTKAKLGPFAATINVSGKFSGAGATGTVDQPGKTCGSSASNPTVHLYKETFTAKRAY